MHCIIVKCIEVLYSAVDHSAVHCTEEYYSVVQYRVLHGITVQSNTMQWRVLLYSAVQSSIPLQLFPLLSPVLSPAASSPPLIVLHYNTWHSAVHIVLECSAVQCSAVMYRTVQWVQYSARAGSLLIVWECSAWTHTEVSTTLSTHRQCSAVKSTWTQCTTVKSSKVYFSILQCRGV